MRDAQSLLDQLLAFGADSLTADQVHKLLGTAPDDVIAGLAAAVLEKDVPRALTLLGAGLSRGLQPGELLDQLIDYWRDLMLIGSGGADVVGLTSSPRMRETIGAQGGATPLDTVLAGLDVFQTTRSRLRGSTHARVLLEMALIRLTRLDDLISLSQMAQMLQGGEIQASSRPTTPGLPTSAPRPAELAEAAKKKPTAATDGPTSTPLSVETLPHIWAEVLTQVGPFLGRELDRAGLPAISGPNRLVLHFPPAYNRQCEFCSDPARLNRVLDALERLTGQTWDLRLEVTPGLNGHPRPGVPAAVVAQPADLGHPLVRSVIDVLGAKLLHVDEGFGQAAPTADDADALPPEPEEQ
jgi:DNA polymerase-3 subunit gamma/tau